MRVLPDCTKSSTITTWRPLGSPSLRRTNRWSPSLTLLQIIWSWDHKFLHISLSQATDIICQFCATIVSIQIVTTGKCWSCLWNLFHAPSSGKAIEIWKRQCKITNLTYKSIRGLSGCLVAMLWNIPIRWEFCEDGLTQEGQEKPKRLIDPTNIKNFGMSNIILVTLNFGI